MTTETKKAVSLPPLSVATLRYVDRNQALVTVIKYFGVVLFVLSCAVGVLTWNSIKLSGMLAKREPVIVRVDQVGRAEAVNVKTTNAVTETDVRYFIGHWVQDTLERRHNSLLDVYPRTMFFLDPSLRNRTMQNDKVSGWMDKFLSDPNAEETKVIIFNVVPDLSHYPYTARVDFAKSFSVQGRELRLERWTADVQFEVWDSIPNDLIPINPRGFFLRYMPRYTQEFEDVDAHH